MDGGAVGRFGKRRWCSAGASVVGLLQLRAGLVWLFPRRGLSPVSCVGISCLFPGGLDLVGFQCERKGSGRVLLLLVMLLEPRLSVGDMFPTSGTRNEIG